VDDSKLIQLQDAVEMERAFFISITFLLLAFTSVIVWKVICINTVLFNIHREIECGRIRKRICVKICVDFKENEAF